MGSQAKNSSGSLIRFVFPLAVALLLLLCKPTCEAATLEAQRHGGGGGNGKRESTSRKAAAAAALYVVGDSYADTGNLGDLGRELTHAWYDPYGDTFPGRPSGRFSDGRVLTDFVASILGLPTPVAYKLRRGYSRRRLVRGMNFAVGGAGVLDTGNFQRNVSAQIDLLEAQLARGALSGSDVRSAVALVVVSGNDYSYVAEKDNSTSAAIAYIPEVVREMRVDLRRLQDLEVGKVMVTNLHPIGCTPLFSRPLNNYTDCDELANLGSLQHNTALQAVLHGLDPTNRTFLLLDLNGPFTTFVQPSSDQGGIEQRKFKNPRRPCCESFSPDGYCGEEDEKGYRQYSLCDNPNDHFYWDSVHPTQAAWAAVSDTFKAQIVEFLST